jgi:DhnA family fructose-bisphosphate aldolase class Ia
MAVQMILCVETNKSADTDYVYIYDTINRWYKIDNKAKLSKINMNTKSRYNSKDVVKKIAQMKKSFVLGETWVVYFIDTDHYERNAEQARELNEISNYCKDNGYDLVWFCHDVEEVFWGHKISDSEKVQEASAFRRKKKIEEIQIDKLLSNEMRVRTSNILNVLDKYLKRK